MDLDYVLFSKYSMSTKKRATHGGRREGAGRRRVLKDGQPVTIRIESEDYRDLERIAERWDESVPSIIRRAIKTLLKRHRGR